MRDGGAIGETEGRREERKRKEIQTKMSGLKGKAEGYSASQGVVEAGAS